MRITIHDTRKCGYCIQATRPWMQNHGFDFRDFVKNGIDWEDMKHIDEEVVHRAYQQACLREASEDGKQ